MIWALWEILIPLLIAVGVGLLIGWLLFRWRRRLVAASEWNQLSLKAQTAQLELVSARAAHDEAVNERSVMSSRLANLMTDHESTKAELGAASRSTEGLATDLDATRSKIAMLRAELDQSNARAATLDDETSTLRSDLDAAMGSLAVMAQRADRLDTERATANAEITALRADLAADTGAANELEASIASAAAAAAAFREAEAKAGELDAALRASRSELDHSQSRIADLDTRLVSARADLDASYTRVGELEGQLSTAESEGARPASVPQQLQPLASSQVGTWQFGTTELGTPGAKHIDDLQVINGIGPKMEELLNKVGITAWEQVASLRAAEVVELNTALDFFHGRIERDEWVDQAKELVEQFPDTESRPTRETYLNRSKDDDPLN
jgi:predicted flap endonuclease-1-like 5' DNA nuclease